MRVAGIYCGALKKPDLLTLMNLRFNGSNGSQSFVDSSLYNRIFSVTSGSPALSTAESVSGGSSLLLGNNGTIQTPDAADYELGAQAFTIGFWLKPDLATFPNNTYQGVFAKGETIFFNSNYSYYGYLYRDPSGTTGYFRFHYFIQVVAQASTNVQAALDLSQWNYIELVRAAGGQVKLYVNGVLAVTGGSYSQAINDSNQPFYIGREVVHTGDFVTTANKYTGYIDNFKLERRVLHTSNFVPPT